MISLFAVEYPCNPSELFLACKPVATLWFVGQVSVRRFPEISRDYITMSDEALGLEIGKHISPDFRTLYIRQKAKAGEIYDYLKAKNGERDVNLCVDLAEMRNVHVGTRTSGLSGKQVSQRNILRDSLHPSLKGLAHVRGGFHIFRRYRITLRGMSGCPGRLKLFWSGHAPKHVSERYEILLGEREYRLEWAERIGLGSRFRAQLANLSSTRVKPGLLRVVSNTAQVSDLFGGRDRGRTGDLIVANDALSQLSYSPTSSISKFNKG
jgi:hypothetical protein